MKRSLGKVFLLITLFLQLPLFATTYEWSAQINKQKAFVNEAVYIRYTCAFSDRAELYSIEFNPSGEYEKFSVKSLQANESIVEGKKISSYEFLLFAKESGEIEIAFEALMKLTSKDSIEEMVIGRDNVKKEDAKKTVVKQEVFKVLIEETPSDLVGDFAVDVKKREPLLKAYEPYHLDITIKGEGNFERIEPFSYEIEGVKVFAGEAVSSQKLTKEAQSGVWSQKFAFVGEKSFTIPKKEIEYFSLKTKKVEKLVVDAVDVKVEGGFAKEELLDVVQKEGFSFDVSYLYYLLTFVAGFLVGKIKRKKSPQIKSGDAFSQKTKGAKSLDALMVLLVVEDALKYETLIKEIEQKKITSLASAKKIAQKLYNASSKKRGGTAL
ncbi:MAG: hypothetical protein PHX44_00920 [Sulfurimonas sp.]|uniref:hypothetical protein n=1 Tax=Sulfurimonas sp. TaxID=2022749 RepID=UPI00261E1E05|nr:hypothetical protein [Sulfurimonas sp.]MDD2651599.1 hypothetical protein [Sulfurimonas sp.]MDD3451410.1 hypothetical protein [Sulfurimonas sp.]